MYARSLRRPLTLLAVALWPALARAQTGSVSGTVTDSLHTKPVAGAVVQALIGDHVVAAGSTQDDGRYQLSKLAPGSYTMVFKKIGLAPARRMAITVTSTGSATLDVRMAPLATDLNPVVTVASRHEEASMTAPAAIVVAPQDEIQTRPSATVADHLEALPGVDINKTGIAESNIVARGFNNAFSGSMLMLQDYRFASVPSLQVNVPFLFTGSNEDIDHIEVLLGPAAALYGPNSAGGVLHIVTKSPFESQGTTITADAGSRSFGRLSMRTAQTFGDKVGIKLSGEIFSAHDWEYTDPGEPTVLLRPDAAGQKDSTPISRDFNLQRATGEARVDIHPTPGSELVTTYGITRLGNDLELTASNGTAQARGWTYQSVQERFKDGRFFAQAFMNASNAGNKDSLDPSGTFLLRTGAPIVDQSRVVAGQIQYGSALGAREDLGYGLDYIYTDPRTGGTIDGRNENDDHMTQIGGYVTSTTKLADQWDFIGALRDDHNDRLSGSQFSPRAALVFKPSPTQNIRFTYDRAFATPSNFSMFLDLLQAADVGGSPYNVQAVGNPPKTGWTFNRSCDPTVNGGLCMMSPFLGAQAANTFVSSTSSLALPGLIAVESPVLIASFTPQIKALLVSQGVPSSTADQQAAVVAGQLVTYLATLRPGTQDVGTRLAQINDPGTTSRTAASITDIAPLNASYNTNYEVGYKGIINNHLRLAVNTWYQRRGDVGTPADVVTPMVYADSASLAKYLGAALTPALQQQGLSQPVAQGTAAGIGQQLANSFKGVPLGVVTFNNAAFASPTNVYATYVTYNKEISVVGAEMAADLLATDAWTFAGTYSWVSKVLFTDIASSNNEALMLNAPDHKGSLGAAYKDSQTGWGFDLRARYFNSYPVNSGVYATGVDFTDPNTGGTYRYEDIRAATLFDAGIQTHLKLFGMKEMLWSLTGENLFNHPYRTFPGAPALGRMLMTRVQYQF